MCGGGQPSAGVCSRNIRYRTDLRIPGPLGNLANCLCPQFAALNLENAYAARKKQRENFCRKKKENRNKKDTAEKFSQETK
jgi:hypothetical protein